MTFIDDILKEAEEADDQRRVELDKLRADRFLMAIRVLEDGIEEVDTVCDAEMKLIEEYRKSESLRLGKKARWLAWNLEQYMRGTEQKTTNLPHGVLKLRKGRDKIEVSDLEQFLKSPENQQFLRTVPESFQPDLAEIHTYIKGTGHIPDGVNLVPAEVKFSYLTIKRSATNGKAGEQRATEAGTEAERDGESETAQGQAVRG
jgi:hypothetical protein